MSDHTDTTLTDTERRYAYEHFGDDDEHFGRCYLEADVESIVAARVAAARAERDTEWRALLETHIQQREDDRYVLHGVARFALRSLAATGPGALIEGADQ